jgi:hypothetical protein
VEAAVEETLAYYVFTEEHWRRIRTINVFGKRFCGFFGFSNYLIYFLCPGDRVAKSRVEVESPAAQPMSVAPLLRHPDAAPVALQTRRR